MVLDNKICIRNLQEKDLGSLAELYRQFWNEISDTDRMKSRFMELKDNPKYIFLCADYDGIVAGSVMGIICDELYGDCRPFMLMDDMIVDVRYRHNGVGKLLLTELEKRAEDNSCSQIIFVTENDREDAVSFYKSCGYNPGTHTGFKKRLI